MLHLKEVMRHKIVFALGVTAAASGSMAMNAAAGEYYVRAAAPITYKMSNPAEMMAHGYAPQYNAPQTAMPQQPLYQQQPQQPQYQPPQYQPPQVQQPQYQPQAALPSLQFDQSRVDSTLYSHQRVGNPYTVAGQTYYPKHQPMYDMVGTASWYGDKFHGKLTANGEFFDKNAMTAAHKTLPLNSYVIVTNMATGQSLKLRINDRGPFIGGRIIDLSEAAAEKLGYKSMGLGDVRVQYAGPAEPVQQAQNAPAPQYAEGPAEAPGSPSAPYIYEPLRQLPQPFTVPNTPMPVQSQHPQLNVPNIMVPAPMMPQAGVPSAPTAIPQPYAENSGGDDQFVTLTIKGPVHMASYDEADSEPRLIFAVNRTTYKTR